MRSKISPGLGRVVGPNPPGPIGPRRICAIRRCIIACRIPGRIIIGPRIGPRQCGPGPRMCPYIGPCGPRISPCIGRFIGGGGIIRRSGGPSPRARGPGSAADFFGSAEPFIFAQPNTITAASNDNAIAFI